MARFGLYLPNAGFEGVSSPGAVLSYPQRAWELGFGSLWVEDRRLHALPILEALATLIFTAPFTKKLRRGTSILLFNLRNPSSSSGNATIPTRPAGNG